MPSAPIGTIAKLVRVCPAASRLSALVDGRGPSPHAVTNPGRSTSAAASVTAAASAPEGTPGTERIGTSTVAPAVRGAPPPVRVSRTRTGPTGRYADVAVGGGAACAGAASTAATPIAPVSETARQVRAATERRSTPDEFVPPTPALPHVRAACHDRRRGRSGQGEATHRAEVSTLCVGERRWWWPEVGRAARRARDDDAVAILRDDLDRRIVRLAVPALGTLAVEPIYVLVDTAIVGQIGTEQLAGLAIAATILLTVVSLMSFLEYGVTPSVAYAHGAGRDDRGATARRRRARGSRG